MFFDARKQICADIKIEIAIEFANTGGAGHVDLGNVITDDVNADKGEAAARKLG